VPVDIQVIERRPRPHRIPILININKAISNHFNTPGIARQVREGSIEADQQNRVAIVERQYVVVKTLGR
jgi:hypothetical protein